MSSKTMDERAFKELLDRHRDLYDGPAIDPKLKSIIRAAPCSKLSDWDIHRMLRTSRSVFFDTHVEVVSGHHTATYLRFTSIARFPQLVRLIVRDMADWIRQTFQKNPIVGIVATASEARLLADGVASILQAEMPVRVVLTPYSPETGKIGTEVSPGSIKPGERFVALNDVTTRRSEEHTSELQSQSNLVCRLLLEKKNIYLTVVLHHRRFDCINTSG